MATKFAPVPVLVNCGKTPEAVTPIDAVATPVRLGSSTAALTLLAISAEPVKAGKVPLPTVVASKKG